MKKNISTVFTCLLILFTVLTGCDGLSGKKPAPPSVGSNDTGSVKPDNIIEKNLSDLPQSQQTEIKKLYGCYWSENGSKEECLEISDNALTVYSTTMGRSFANIRWSKTDSAWICTSYGADEEDYAPENQRVVFTFEQDSSGKIRLYQEIKRMELTIGPYIKGKPIERFPQQDGTILYAYDENSAKMKEPEVK